MDGFGFFVLYIEVEEVFWIIVFLRLGLMNLRLGPFHRVDKYVIPTG